MESLLFLRNFQTVKKISLKVAGEQLELNWMQNEKIHDWIKLNNSKEQTERITNKSNMFVTKLEIYMVSS